MLLDHSCPTLQSFMTHSTTVYDPFVTTVYNSHSSTIHDSLYNYDHQWPTLYNPFFTTVYNSRSKTIHDPLYNHQWPHSLPLSNWPILNNCPCYNSCSWQFMSHSLPLSMIHSLQLFTTHALSHSWSTLKPSVTHSKIISDPLYDCLIGPFLTTVYNSCSWTIHDSLSTTIYDPFFTTVYNSCSKIIHDPLSTTVSLVHS